MIREQLVEALAPVTEMLKSADLDSPSFLEDMEKAFPREGAGMRTIAELALRGMQAGEICHQGEGEIRFSRVSKPSEATSGFSIDAVHMSGQGPEHTHPKGEVSFCIAVEGDPDFDGYKAGWALCRPGSTHIPTVTNGKMLIIYFLPDGSVVWKK